MNTYIVTGATRGLGLATAKALAKRPGARVVLAVRDAERGARLAAQIGPAVEVAKLDLSSLADVKRFTDGWSGPIAGLVNNAGLQQTAGMHRTPDGYEETFAVNHLGAFALTMGLLPWLDGGRVLFIGSGTHNPDNAAARRFGFRGAQLASIAAMAKGTTEALDEGQAGRDRYATSKFLNTISARELSARHPKTEFVTLDPGLMPGTGLARTQPLLMRMVWSTLLRVVALAIADASTPAKSGATAAWLMTEASLQRGACYSFDRRRSKQVWRRVDEPALGAQVVDETLALLRAYPPGLVPVTSVERSSPPV